MAYADFVTAMMALFMVLWISAQDKEILIATSQYFQNPFRSPMDATSGVMPFNSNKTTNASGSGQGTEKEQDRSKHIQMTFLNSVASDFYRLLNLDQSLESKPIDVQVTSDGLRVTLFDRAKSPLFKSGSTELTEWGTFALQSLAWMIDRHRFFVTIDGHAGTIDPKAPGARADGDGWQLSTDRANVARRALVHYAVEPKLIERVTGYSDTRPIPGEAADANDRVTLNLTLSAKGRSREDRLSESPIPVVPDAR